MIKSLVVMSKSFQKLTFVITKIKNCLRHHYLDQVDFEPKLLTNILLEIYEQNAVNINEIENKLAICENVQKIQPNLYVYKPPLENVRTMKDLLGLLESQFERTGCGYYIEEIINSVPNALAVLRELENAKKITIIGGVKKRKSIFPLRQFSELKSENFDLIKEFWR